MENDMFKKWEGYLTIGSAKEKLQNLGANVPIPTIRNWVNELHQLQVHTLPRNQRMERIFSETDVQILLYVFEAKKRFGNNLTMEAIVAMIQDHDKLKDHLNYDPTDGGQSDPGGLAVSEHRIRELLRSEMNEMKQDLIKAKEIYETAAAKLETQLLMLPDPEVEKSQRTVEMRTLIFDARATERKVRSRLKERAEGEWAKNPVKRGLIFKSEDLGAKTIFIESYIEKHIDDEIKKEAEN